VALPKPNHPATAALAIEVADSSQEHDLLTKPRVYALAGVPTNLGLARALERAAIGCLIGAPEDRSSPNKDPLARALVTNLTNRRRE